MTGRVPAEGGDTLPGVTTVLDLNLLTLGSPDEGGPCVHYVAQCLPPYGGSSYGVLKSKVFRLLRSIFAHALGLEHTQPPNDPWELLPIALGGATCAPPLR